MTPIFSLRNKRVWIAGQDGMVGRALRRRLADECTLLDCPRAILDLRRQNDVENWMAHNKPDVVVIAAATVGGIGANAARPADFLYDNLMIAANIVHAAHAASVRKLLFLGSSCIYPRLATQPIGADALLSGPLEPTNEAYALAKIAGVKLCQAYRRQHGCDFISAMPCNLYGPGDRYDADASHVIPALLLKFDEARRTGARSVTLWGTGRPLREFLHVDDLAGGLAMLLGRYSGDAPVNVGSGAEISIAELANKIALVTGFAGDIFFDPAHPDGTPRKLLDSSQVRALGWQPSIRLDDGLRDAYHDYITRYRSAA